jgi:hypothetical protein
VIAHPRSLSRDEREVAEGPAGKWYRLEVSSLRHPRGRIVGFVLSLAVPLGVGAGACDSQWVTLGRVGGIPDKAPTSAGSNAFSAGGSAASMGGSVGGSTPSTGGSAPSMGGGAGSSSASAGGSAAGAGQAGTSAGLTEPHFTDIRPVFGTVSSYEDDNPTLTADLRELYFSSKNRPGGKGNVDVWVARRSSATAEFGEPVDVAEVSTEGIESSPAISADGLVLWLGAEPTSGGLGGYDILQSTRTSRSDVFGAPVLVTELSSDKDDIPRPPGNHDLTMPIASRRDSTTYLTYLAIRSTIESSFSKPALVQELVVEGANTADAFLTNDGLVMYLAHSVNSRSDLYVTRRPSLDAPFGNALPLTTINTENDERDPWLSPDGTQLFFSSDRDHPGTLNLYQATLVAEP